MWPLSFGSVPVETKKPFDDIDMAVPSDVLHPITPNNFTSAKHEFATNPENVSAFGLQVLSVFCEIIIELRLQTLVLIDAFHVITPWTGINGPAHSQSLI
jgi:hypothetical protein